MAAQAIGTAMGVLGGLFSKGPKVPKYEKIDQAKEQDASISSNLASFSKAKELAAKTSAADQDILMANLQKADPNYLANISSASGTIGNMMAGKLPMGDQSLLMRRAAESGMTGGMSGSQAGRNLVARDLGLSQMNMMQAGLGAHNAHLSTLRNTAVANPMSLGASYVNPAQWTQTAMSENRFAHQNAVAMAGAKAANSFGNRLGGAMQSVGGMMAGGMFGGGGGGGGGGMFGNMFGGTGVSAGTPSTLGPQGFLPRNTTLQPSFNTSISPSGWGG